MNEDKLLIFGFKALLAEPRSNFILELELKLEMATIKLELKLQPETEAKSYFP